jgi:Ca2+-binding RTX toxin-like protein
VTVDLAAQTVTAAAGDGDTDTLATVENATGTPFADTLNGSSTTVNTLSGLAGDDTMKGDLKASNNDNLISADVFSGGDGTDTVSYADDRRGHNAGVTVTLDDQANDGGDADTSPAGTGVQAEGDNVKSDVENVIGASGNDTFTGSSAKNDFTGADGTDTVSFAGRSGAVTASVSGGQTGGEGDTWKTIENLVGGSGDDVLIGDAGANALQGGPGNDVLRGGMGNDALNGNEGSNTADYSQDGRAAGVSVDLDAATGAEDTGLANIQNVIGTDLADTLRGSAAANTILGLGGNDTLSGRFGDDVLDGGAGADDMNGGQGADTVSYQGRTGDVSVTLNGTADDGEAGEGDNARTSVENVLGGAGNDIITANPNSTSTANGFSGGAGSDTLTALGGDDVLDGGAGADTVSGGDGKDTLRLVDATADIGNCGGDTDTVEADDIDVLSDCETVARTSTSAGGPPPVTAPASTISVAPVRVREGNSGTTTLTFTVAMSAKQDAPVAVPYLTGGGTARSPQDYAAVAGTLTFAPGETTKTIEVLVKGDKTRERNETFALALSPATGNAKVAAPGYAVATIVNDDNTRRTPKLTAKVDPKRDSTVPYRFVVFGKLKRPKGVGAARGCGGRVRVVFSQGGKTVARRTGFVDASCEYTVPVAVKRTASGGMRVTVRYLGNKALKPVRARVLRARVG